MQISKRCPWVKGTDGTRVKVQSVFYVDADHSGGNLGIYTYCHYQKFLQWGVPYRLLLPGSVDEFATAPEMKVDMAGGNFDPAHGSGPFKIQLDDAYVEGMGLPLNRHVIYVVTFKLPAPYVD